MYRSILSRRLNGLSTTTRNIPWHTQGARIISTTPPVSDDDVEPWNSVEGTHVDESGGEWDGCRRDFMAPIEIGVRGADILHNPFFNKGTAFKTEERDRLRFRGLLPARFNNIKMQMERFLVALRSTESNIQKNIKLEDLHDTNETLYHRILVDHIEGGLFVGRNKSNGEIRRSILSMIHSTCIFFFAASVPIAFPLTIISLFRLRYVMMRDLSFNRNGPPDLYPHCRTGLSGTEFAFSSTQRNVFHRRR